jgi:hypothetical protein
VPQNRFLGTQADIGQARRVVLPLAFDLSEFVIHFTLRAAPADRSASVISATATSAGHDD